MAISTHLECTCCLQVPPPNVKIYSCKRGHLICEPDLIAWVRTREETRLSELSAPPPSCAICRSPLKGPRDLVRLVPVEQFLSAVADKVNSQCVPILGSLGFFFFLRSNRQRRGKR